MIYAIDEYKRISDYDRYKFFETHSESFFNMDEDEIKNILNDYKMDIKNISIGGYDIVTKPWFNGIHNSTTKELGYVLLCKVDTDKFKLVSSFGHIVYVNEDILKDHIKSNRIANCNIENGQYKVVDNYDVARDQEFEKEIVKKYERYSAISTALGREMDFEYSIEGNEVRLIKYTGTSKQVIIPKFITAVMPRAFRGCGIEELTLENGLKAIGSFAFEKCKISQVEIPKSVEFIGYGAFYENRKLVSGNFNYKSTIKILNEKATIIDNYISSIG